MSDNVEIYIWCSVKHHQLLHWQLLDKIQGRLSGNVVSVSTVFLFLFSRVPQNKQRNCLTFLESTGNHDFKTNTTLLSMCYVNKWSSYSTTLILVLHLQLHNTFLQVTKKAGGNNIAGHHLFHFRLCNIKAENEHHGCR